MRAVEPFASLGCGMGKLQEEYFPEGKLNIARRFNAGIPLNKKDSSRMDGERVGA